LLAKAVAARLVTRLVDAVGAKGLASVVLTGGGIGTQVLAELAAAPARDAVDWRRVEIWWGDERLLAAGAPERNETGARSTLDHVDVLPRHVHHAGARRARRAGSRGGRRPVCPRTARGRAAAGSRRRAEVRRADARHRP
jgi:6-phosphogluconolactonase/glucosamine-6-phosphate isomerase/deaminase